MRLDGAALSRDTEEREQLRRCLGAHAISLHEASTVDAVAGPWHPAARAPLAGVGAASRCQVDDQIEPGRIYKCVVLIDGSARQIVGVRRLGRLGSVGAGRARWHFLRVSSAFRATVGCEV